MTTYREILNSAREILRAHEIADADVDAWYLLAHVMRINRAEYILKREQNIPEEKAKEYMELVHHRASRIPLQHLTKTQEFMGLEFCVNQDVLIPRQDTECLVEEVLKVCDGKTVLDLCTGSGCIIISLAKLGNLKNGTAVDLSDKALAVAKENACNLGAEVTFIKSDLYDQVEGTFDIIVSNPPYIKTSEMLELMPEVRDHEPVMALEAGPDGLEFYQRIISDIPVYLKKNGWIFFEIGCTQGKGVADLLDKAGFREIEVKKDLSGLDRVVLGRYR